MTTAVMSLQTMLTRAERAVLRLITPIVKRKNSNI